MDEIYFLDSWDILFDGGKDWCVFTKMFVNETKYLLSKHYLLSIY